MLRPDAIKAGLIKPTKEEAELMGLTTADEPAEDPRTVKELIAELEARGIEVPAKAKKAELIELIAHRV